jgi:hypothetical protein
MTTSLIFLLGATNAGKSTFLRHFLDTHPEARSVEVGKTLRAKYLDPASPHYQPDYFKGSAAPEHTESEAWLLMVRGITDGIAAQASHLVIDGQPRTMRQAWRAATELGSIPRVFLHLWAPPAVRRARAEARDRDNPDALRLALQRMDSDPPVLYDVIGLLDALDQSVGHMDTTLPPNDHLDEFLDEGWSQPSDPIRFAHLKP